MTSTQWPDTRPRRGAPAGPAALRTAGHRVGGARNASGPAPAASAAPAAGVGAHAVLVLLVAVLCLVGLVMVLSASASTSLTQYGSPWHFFERELVWLAAGTGAFAVAWRVGPGRLRRLARPALVVSIGALLAVLVPGVGIRVGGAARWIGTSSLQLQPSEVAKLVLVLFAADALDRRAGAPDVGRQIAPVVAALGVMAVLVMAQPDMGTTMVLATIGMAMLFTAGVPAKPMVTLGAVGAGLAGLLAVMAPYRVRRLTSFRDPMAHATGTGYQAVQGLVALGHGRLLGDGLGSSILSSGYLPNASTDFIFAVIGEEAGLVGTLGVTALFAAFAVVGTRITCRTPDRHAALVCAGVLAWLVSQAIINIGAVVGLLPVTGVPLPFVSFGGSSLVIALFAVGLVAHAARRA
ncbi:MAG TPA: putative lipid II flippase FtsW [Acidimicrobiales bacterium]|nr:putative lipid II flippase FtsW [Acidimicrobiales bacterium]